MANLNARPPVAGNSAPSASDPAKPRRPYEAPAIEETSAFETLALNCTGLVNETTCYQTYSYHNS
jgi:hypothetical protein